MFGAYSSHRHNRREVAFLANSHHCHRGAVTRRFGHTERQVSQRNQLGNRFASHHRRRLARIEEPSPLPRVPHRRGARRLTYARDRRHAATVHSTASQRRRRAAPAHRTLPPGHAGPHWRGCRYPRPARRFVGNGRPRTFSSGPRETCHDAWRFSPLCDVRHVASRTRSRMAPSAGITAVTNSLSALG